MTELEIDMNMRIGEWSILQESGRQLTPCYGPGYTGLSNLGNRWGVRERGERKEGGRVVEGSIGGTADGCISLSSQLLSQFSDAGDVLHARVQTEVRMF